MEKNMDFSNVHAEFSTSSPEDRTKLDQVQRFITFCDEARRAPYFHQGFGRLYNEMAKPLAKANWEEEEEDSGESVVRRRRRMMKLQNADANDAG